MHSELRGLTCRSAWLAAISVALGLGSPLSACMPAHDLDRLSAGTAAGADNGGSASAGGPGAGAPSVAGDAQGGAEAQGGSPSNAQGGNGVVAGSGGGGGGVVSEAGGPPSCQSLTGFAAAPLGDVPEFSENSPVSGEVQLALNSTWEVEPGVQEPAFQVRTPTAIYFLHQASGALVSLTDPDSATQWIQYSYGGQPDRGVPLLGGCCSPPAGGKPAAVPMQTTKDDSKSSSTHLHIDSVSADSKWRLSWDFYLTHATVTVELAAADYGFSYKGTPSGPKAELKADLWLNGLGQQDAAVYASTKDLPYPEWVRFADRSTTGQSLFLVQHRDDCLPDRYQPRDLSTEKTAVFTFGDGKIPASRKTRVSFGLVANDQAQARIDYVVKLMQ